MSSEDDIGRLLEFLGCETPQAWLDAAQDNHDILLVDHANCEKKAASTALNLLYRYVEHHQLLEKLSRLAREELRHFEQVIAIMHKRDVAYPQISASRYAGELRKQVRTHEPGRLIDTLLVGAIIEARSCERFAALAPEFDARNDHVLGEFYRSLLKSEARHFEDYLTLAEQLSTAEEVAERLPLFVDREAELINSEDSEFRFHSGIPARGAVVFFQ